MENSLLYLYLSVLIPFFVIILVGDLVRRALWSTILERFGETKRNAWIPGKLGMTTFRLAGYPERLGLLPVVSVLGLIATMAAPFVIGNSASILGLLFSFLMLVSAIMCVLVAYRLQKAIGIADAYIVVYLLTNPLFWLVVVLMAWPQVEVSTVAPRSKKSKR